MKKEKKLNIVVLIILVSSLLVIGFVLNRTLGTRVEQENAVKNIFEYPMFSIGTVEHFTAQRRQARSSRRPEKSRVTFEYNVNGENIEKSNNWYHVPYSGIMKGERYIVLYPNADPRSGLMLFQYPIRQESDFVNYLEEFKSNPPRFIPWVTGERFMFTIFGRAIYEPKSYFIFISIGVFLVIVSLLLFLRRFNIIMNGIEIDATFIRYEKEHVISSEKNKSTTIMYFPVFSYTVDGKEYETRGNATKEIKPLHKKSSIVEIICHRYNPKKAIMPKDGSVFLLLIFNIVGLVLIIIPHLPNSRWCLFW